MTRPGLESGWLALPAMGLKSFQMLELFGERSFQEQIYAPKAHLSLGNWTDWTELPAVVV